MPVKRRKNRKVIKDFEMLVESLFNNREINLQYDESMTRASLIIDNNYRISFQRKTGTNKYTLTDFCDLESVSGLEMDFIERVETRFDIDKIPRSRNVI